MSQLKGVAKNKATSFVNVCSVHLPNAGFALQQDLVMLVKGIERLGKGITRTGSRKVLI